MIQLRSFYDIPPPESSLPQKENGIAAKNFYSDPGAFSLPMEQHFFFYAAGLCGLFLTGGLADKLGHAGDFKRFLICLIDEHPSNRA